MACSTASSAAETTTSVVLTATSRTLSVRHEAFSIYSNPCAYLQANLLPLISADASIPASASYTCSLDSISVLSSGKRLYLFTLVASWTE